MEWAPSKAIDKTVPSEHYLTVVPMGNFKSNYTQKKINMHFTQNAYHMYFYIQTVNTITKIEFTQNLVP